jgi:membrane fusion protein, multidrug efflux system
MKYKIFFRSILRKFSLTSRAMKGGSLIFFFFLVACYLRFGVSEEEVQPKGVKVSVIPVVREDVPFNVDLVGTIQPYMSVAVKSRLDSQVIKVNFKDGDDVTIDQVLFELDDRVIKAQLEQLRANLKRDEAELSRAKRQLERDEKLKDKGVSSLEKYDTTRSAFQAAEAGVLATKAQIQNLEIQLDYARVKAPIAGRAGTIQITQGNTVKANDTTPLVIINQVKPIKAYIPFPQRYYNPLRRSLENKEAVKVIAKDTDGQILGEGTLDYKENTLDEATRTLAVRAVFLNEAEKLWPGMFVDVEVTLSYDKNALVVPLTAVQLAQQGNYIYKVINGKAKRLNVKILRETKEKAIVEGDLLPGEKVIVDGHLRLKDGMPVEIVSEAK